MKLDIEKLHEVPSYRYGRRIGRSVYGAASVVGQVQLGAKRILYYVANHREVSRLSNVLRDVAMELGYKSSQIKRVGFDVVMINGSRIHFVTDDCSEHRLRGCEFDGYVCDNYADRLEEYIEERV